MKITPITNLEQIRIFVTYCIERDTIVRSIKTALVVGTILALINHGQDILSGQFSWHWMLPMLISYLVPFSVATYGQVQGKRQRDRLNKVVDSIVAPQDDVTPAYGAPSSDGGHLPRDYEDRYE